MQFKQRLSTFSGTRLFRILTHPILLSIFLGILIWLLLPFRQVPYLFKIDREISKTKKDIRYYGYLIPDSIPKSFFFTEPDQNLSSLVVKKNENVVLDQWNFFGSISHFSVGDFISDYDGDGFREIACFSLKGDSILLNVVEPFENKKHLVKNRLIDRTQQLEMTGTLTISDFQCWDLTGDKTMDLVFTISMGYGLQPRAIYMYDIKKDKVSRSPYSGICYGSFLIIDMDQDGKSEIVAGNNSANNYDEEMVLYPDTISYFVVLDHQLDYKIDPKRVGGLFSIGLPLKIETEKETELWIVSSANPENEPLNYYYKVNSDYSLSISDSLPELGRRVINQVSYSASHKIQVLLGNNDQSIYLLRKGRLLGNQDFSHPVELIPVNNYHSGLKDIEYAVAHHNLQSKIEFYGKSGQLLGNLDLKISGSKFRMYWLHSEKHNKQFSIVTEGYEFQGRAKRNQFYSIKYFILLAIAGGLYALFSLIRWIQANQLARTETLRREALELQLKSIRNHLDPHFTFNALNTLSGLAITGDQSGVEHFINHFSRLLRSHLQTADKILIPLRDEMEFVLNYVELQRIRFEKTFELEVDISGSIDLSILIPRMLIQTHVENSIKHGVRFGGIIRVKAREHKEELIIEIEDNGKGRGTGPRIDQESTGTGLKMQDRIIRSVKELYQMDIKFQYIDLFDHDGNSAGTVARIQIKY